MAQLTQSTAYTRAFVMVQSADHITGITGATVTVNLSKAGAAFTTAGGTVSEISSGWYEIALTTTDTGTLGDLAFHCTATSADPTDFVDQITAGGNSITSNVKKNQALNNFAFVMTDSTSHLPKTGLTVNAQRSIDGAAFASTTNNPTELSNGVYKINLLAAELNGNVIVLRFTAVQSDDLILTIITQP